MNDLVFVCYSREDEDFTLKLAANLKKQGIPIWLDQWDILTGSNWIRAIEKALSECTHLLLVLSPSSVESDEIKTEWLTALDEHKVVIPVLYRQCGIPIRLLSIPYIDFTSSSPNDEAPLGRVMEALRINVGSASKPQGQREQEPQDASNLLETGEVLSEQGRYEEAIKSYDKAIELNPQFAESWSAKGNALIKLDRNSEANQAFDQAIRINGQLYDAWYGKGYSLDHLRDYEGSLKCFDRAIEIKPDYLDALIAKGHVLGKHFSKHAEALNAFDEAIKIKPRYLNDPRYLIAWINKAETLAEMGKDNEAQEAVKKVFELHPTEEQVNYINENILKNLKQEDKSSDTTYMDSEKVEQWSSRVAPDDVEKDKAKPIEPSKPSGPVEEKRPLQGGVLGAQNDGLPPEDQLGFEQYVEAFADLIESSLTKPPLTIGIYGSWGTGKTFLMQSIGDKLDKRKDIRNDIENIRKKNGNDQKEYAKEILSNFKNKELPIYGYLFPRLSKEVREKINNSGDDASEGFLNQLASDTERVLRSLAMVYIINFNAWEYSSSEVIWPGLVREIMKKMEGKSSGSYLDLPKRKFYLLKHKYKRSKDYTLDWTIGQLPTLAIITLILYIIISKINFTSIPGAFKDIFALILSLGAATLLTNAKNFYDIINNPLSEWIAFQFKSCDYGRQIGYMETIKDDMEFLRSQMQEDDRILVTIDDLDRCEPEKAVEVLQAINLLLNFKNFIVMMGIDSRVITCAIEEHYKNMLGPAGTSGYEYLEKIVQIPFRIPEPNDDEISDFINKQLSESKETTPIEKPVSDVKTLAVGPSEQPTTIAPTEALPDPSKQPDATPKIAPTSSSGKGEGGIYLSDNDYDFGKAFTDEERDEFKALSRFIRHNPRHIKRLVNIYLLVRALGKYKERADILRKPKIVLYWLVLCGQWPYTMSLMLNMFEKLVRDKKINLEKPPNGDPLKYLYNLAIRFPKFSVNKQKELDYEPDLIYPLLDYGKNRLSWKNLAIISQYTVNFNPAIEKETNIENLAENLNYPSIQDWVDWI